MTTMHFWGTEVKPGQAVLCDASKDSIVHISQAALGKTKKESDNVVVSVKVDDKKMVIGTLSAVKLPQTMHDLIFEKEFELSHNSKTISVFLSGYTIVNETYSTDDEDSDEEEETNKNSAGNIVSGKAEEKAPFKVDKMDKHDDKGKVPLKADKMDKHDDKGKAPLKVDQTDKHDDGSDEDESDDSQDDLSSSSDDSMSEDDSGTEDDSSGEDDDKEDEMDEDDDDDEEDTPLKPETGKKRVAETSLKTPASDKKTKTATPSGQKTGDKKGAHVATPHPAKQASKAPANNKSKENSPKSAGGSHACKSCTKTFGSDAAFQSHQRAKHNTTK